MITHVAININGMICSMPKPARHHDLLTRLEGASKGHLHDQGFLRNGHHFLSRTQAKRYAVQCKQIKSADMICSTLTSEDLW